MQQPQQAQPQQAQSELPPGQDGSRRGSTTQPVPGVEGRNTPTPNRVRDDPENIDVRALLQKHEELRKFFGLFVMCGVITTNKNRIEIFQSEAILF
jgi:hypothetical protein